MLDIASDFQQAIEHFGALCAADCKLGVCLFVRLLKAVELVGDVQGRQNCDLQRIDGQRAGRNLAHAAVHKVGEFREIF